MEEYRKTSFLMELVPDIYQFLKGLKPIALIYAVVMGVMITLSLFFQWSFIEFFIEIMMGWTLLSIPFISVILVALDKEFSVQEYELKAKFHHQKAPYILSMIWGIILCILGISTLYFSNKYKKYYAFQCQDFYLEETKGVYHIFKDCEYVGEDNNGDQVDNINLINISGKDLLDTEAELCYACEEHAEDAEAEVATYRYRRP